MNPKEVSSAHHILLGGVLVTLQDPDPVFASQVLNLLHRLVPKFLHRYDGPAESKASRKPPANPPPLHIYIPGTLLSPTSKSLEGWNRVSCTS